MAKRQRAIWLRLIAISLLPLGIIGFVLMSPSTEEITEANANKIYKQISEGITIQEVENLLGLPAGDYSRARDLKSWQKRTINGGIGDLGRPASHIWMAEEATLWIWTDEEGRVTDLRYAQHAFQGTPFAVWLRNWTRPMTSRSRR